MEKEEASNKAFQETQEPVAGKLDDPPPKADTTVQPDPAASKDSSKEGKHLENSEQEKQEEVSSVEEVVSGLASAASGWLSGWMKTLEVAKDKSAEVYGMVKKDLGEFSEAVQAETSAVISETGSMLHSTSRTLQQSLQMEDESSAAGQVKKSVSGFLTHVQKAFTPDTMQDDDTEAYVLRDGQPVLLDRLQTELYRLSAEPQTFLADIPESELVRYEVWSADVDLDARQAELSDLLASNKAILDQYTRLVPAQVSHATFWHRYLFRIHLAEEREKQREHLRKRADQMTSPGAAEKQVAWEEVFLAPPDDHPADLCSHGIPDSCTRLWTSDMYPVLDTPTYPVLDPPTCRRLDLPTCPVLDTPTYPVLDLPTSAVLDPPACRRLDLPTCHVLDTPTYPVLDLPTSSVLDPPTCRRLDLPTCPVVDTPTYPVLDPPTGPVLDPPTCPVLDTPTYPVLDPPTCETPPLVRHLTQTGTPPSSPILRQLREDFSHHVSVTDAQAVRLLEEYDREMKQRSSPPAAAAATAASAATAAAAADDRPGSQSPGHVSSNEDDWVKEDMDTIETNSSVGNDWEKWE